MKKLFLILLSLLGLNACVSAREKSYTDMDVDGFARLVDGKDVQTLDVRTPEEFAQGHIEGARNINVYDSDFKEQAIAALDKSKPVAVYCRSGKRSAQAAAVLSANGYDVTNLAGGILAWEKAGQPVVE